MKGKIAWLYRGYKYFDDEGDTKTSEEVSWALSFVEPNKYTYNEVKKIVYFEVEED